MYGKYPKIPYFFFFFNSWVQPLHCLKVMKFQTARSETSKNKTFRKPYTNFKLVITTFPLKLILNGYFTTPNINGTARPPEEKKKIHQNQIRSLKLQNHCNHTQLLSPFAIIPRRNSFSLEGVFGFTRGNCVSFFLH